MTVKRFELCEINCFDYGVEVFNEIMDNGVPLSQKQVCELLNGLHETNKQLQHDATILIQSNQDYRKENEELKQRIDNICREIKDKPTMTTTEVMVKLQELIF